MKDFPTRHCKQVGLKAVGERSKVEQGNVPVAVGVQAGIALQSPGTLAVAVPLGAELLAVACCRTECQTVSPPTTSNIRSHVFSHSRWSHQQQNKLREKKKSFNLHRLKYLCSKYPCLDPRTRVRSPVASNSRRT